MEGSAKTKDHQSDRSGSRWTGWQAMNASPSHARSYRAARFPVSLLCVNRRRSLRLLCRLRRRGRKDGGGEGFICGLNANGGECQHRFTRAQNRLITPLTRVQKCNVAPQTSVIGGKEEGANFDFQGSPEGPDRSSSNSDYQKAPKGPLRYSAFLHVRNRLKSRSIFGRAIAFAPPTLLSMRPLVSHGLGTARSH